MSRPVQTNMQCPHCQKVSPFTMWASLNVALNPEQKQRMLEGEAFTFTCPECVQVTQAVYPMLYHDPDRRFMIWLVPSDTTGKPIEPADAGLSASEKAKGYTFRAVKSVNELLGKILTFDAGLDDTTLEMVKFVILSQMPETDRHGGVEIQFVQVDRDPDTGGEILTFALIGPNGTSGASLPREPVYSDMQKTVVELTGGKPPPGPWPHVDAQYLARLMDRSVDDADPTPQPPASDPHKPWWQRVTKRSDGGEGGVDT